ncbi:MAG: ABC transporter ATP-binding protein [Spirochaetaceae bacterium]
MNSDISGENEIILQGENVSKSFGAIKAVSKVNFSVRKNEIFGIIGPNGAGKTTLLSMINGTEQLTEGRIVYKGTEISNLKPYRIAEYGISRTFQVVKPFPGMTLLENVAIGAMFGKERMRHAKEAQEKTRSILEQVRLHEKENVEVENLNVSERKRLELARALAMDPDLVLLDEVMAGSNVQELDLIMNIIQELNKEGRTILLIEHVMKAIMGVSHKIMVMHHGQKIAEDSPENIRNNDEVISAYLGERYAKQRGQNA